MSESTQSVIDVIQLVVNVGALAGGAVVWKLYVDKLKATLASKDAEISSVEKNRDMWRDQAKNLEKRSPESVERVLSERIQIREAEIVRLAEDKGRHEEDLNRLHREKASLESDLSRSRGFRVMLALEDEELEGEAAPENAELDQPTVRDVGEIKVLRLGEVAVDSGQLMVSDPAYIDDEWISRSDSDDSSFEEWITSLKERVGNRSEGSLPPFSYRGAMEATFSQGYGELAFELGHAGAGVVFQTAWGDGMYPIYGELHDDRIVRVYINLG